MRRHPGPAIEVQPRLATLVPERWPVRVIPAYDELLSSWLHRLAFAHGLSPHHFGECLGAGSRTWSTRLDLALPEFVLNHLHHQTGVCRGRIAAMTIGAKEWRPLLLPRRRTQAGQGWRQFCPACLAGFPAGVAPRQRHDLPATSTRSARSLSILPPGPRALQSTRARSATPMRRLRIRSPPGQVA